MLPMLEVTTEHLQLTTTHHTNPADRCGDHVIFSHSPLVLPSLSNVLPAMILQHRIVWSSMQLSCSMAYVSICCVSFRLGFNVALCLRKVVMLLLLLSGDIETNPGPVGEHTVTITYPCQFNNQRLEVGMGSK